LIRLTHPEVSAVNKQGDASSLHPEAVEEERRRVRRLRILIDLTAARLMQSDLTLKKALELVEDAKRGALMLFPGKSFTFELIYRPRLMRIIRERWPERIRDPGGPARETDRDRPHGNRKNADE
jgi:hypothetical protein